MKGQEVAAQMVAQMLPAMRQHGLKVDELFQGLSFTLEDTLDRKRRLPWDDFCTLFERVETALGGPAAYERFFEAFHVASPVMQILAKTVLSVEQLYAVAFERMGRKMYSNVGIRVEPRGPSRLSLECSIADGYREFMTIWHGTLAALRVLPVLMGLPPAVVEAEMTPRRMVALVTLPPSQTVVARTTRWLQGLLARPSQDTGPGPDRSQDAFLALDDSELAKVVAPVGQRLAAHHDVEGLARDVVDHFKTRFHARHAALWARWPGSPALQLVFTWGPDRTESRAIRPLLVGEREVGRISVDIPVLLNGGQVPELDALLAWLAVGVRNCTDPPVPANAAPTEDRAARLAAAKQTWQLSDRQALVLEMLASGAANKEVATGLDISVKGAEYHVAALCQKAGVTNRTSLVARFWGSADA
jgi:DNA-binding CsgD family transcriptional regulator